MTRRSYLALALASALLLNGCSSNANAAPGDGNDEVLTVAMECIYAPYN